MKTLSRKTRRKEIRLRHLVVETCWYNVEDAGAGPLLVPHQVVRPAQQRPELHVGVRGVAKIR